MSTSRPLLERARPGRPLLGLLQTQPNAVLSELAGICGFDFVFVDCEHGFFSDADCLSALQALRATGTSGFIRIRGHDMQAIGRCMDMGADAIVVPNVSTAEQARAAVAARSYAPRGTRGYSAPLQRVTRYGLDMKAHLAAPEKSALLLALIESAAGVENIEEIAAVEGLDGLFIGPSDLSTGLGCLGEFEHLRYIEAVGRIESVAHSRGKVLGTALYAGTSVDALAGRGHEFLVIGADMALMREAMTTLVSKTRVEAALPDPGPQIAVGQRDLENNP